MSIEVEIINLLKKTKRVLMINKDFEADYYDTTARKCKKFGVEGVRDALESWVTKHKFMPKTCELIDECKNRNDFFQSKTSVSPSESRCKYFSENEHEISKSLCKKNDIDEDEVVHSNLRFGMTLCNWHTMCAEAKSYPDGVTAKFVKNHLKTMSKFQNSGDDGVKYQHNDAAGSIFTKMNTNIAGDMASG